MYRIYEFLKQFLKFGIFQNIFRIFRIYEFFQIFIEFLEFMNFSEFMFGIFKIKPEGSFDKILFFSIWHIL